MLTLTGDLNVLTKLAGLAIDLDAIVEKLLKGGAVEDTIGRGARVVDGELVLGSSRLSGGGLYLHGTGKEREKGKPSVSLLRR